MLSFLRKIGGRRERGTAYVETVLVIPVLMLFVTGTIDFMSLVLMKRDMQRTAYEMARVSYSLEKLDQVGGGGSRVTAPYSKNVNLSGPNADDALNAFRLRLNNLLQVKYDKDIFYDYNNKPLVNNVTVGFDPATNILNLQLTGDFHPKFNGFSFIGGTTVTVALRSLYWER